MITTKIDYPYLAGYLEQSIKSLSNDLERNGIIKPRDRKAQKIIDKIATEMIQRALKAEKEFTAKYPE